MSRDVLRKQLLQQRAALSAEYVKEHSQKISDVLVKQPPWMEATTIGIYLSIKNEVDTRPILEAIWESGKKAYAPIIRHCEERSDVAIQYLAFAHYTPTTPLSKNRFGILEPLSPEFFPQEHLDLVLVPLVGFDTQGNRLGMGAGYYDRTFAFLNTMPRPTQPLLVGLAYELQKIDQLANEAWDVPLNAIVTEEKAYFV